MTASSSSSSSSSAFSGYNFSPVTELPSQTEWEFTTTDKTATTHYTNTSTSAMDDDGDATMTMFPFEDSGETENLLSSLSRVTAVISPSSSTDSSEVNNSNVVVFGPHNWMDDENDEDYIEDDEETPRQQQDTVNDDLMARPLEDLFNNALYLENDDDENYLHQEEQAAHYHRRNNHDTQLMMMDDSHGFLAPLLNHVPEPNFVMGGNAAASMEHFNIGLPLEERYMVTLNKLEASMKRSMESRTCLTIQTSVTRQNYTHRSNDDMRPEPCPEGCEDRSTTIRELLSSITTSSNQVQKYVTSIAQHK